MRKTTYYEEKGEENVSCLLCPWIEVPIQSSYNFLTQPQLKIGFLRKNVIAASFLQKLRMEFQRIFLTQHDKKTLLVFSKKKKKI